jgi:hypothetical protein
MDGGAAQIDGRLLVGDKLVAVRNTPVIIHTLHVIYLRIVLWRILPVFVGEFCNLPFSKVS